MDGDALTSVPDLSSCQTVMAFDFGLRRIGVACGQVITGTASPIGTLLAKNGVPDWNQLQQWVREWRPDVIAVGIPLLMNDSEQPLTHAARRFAQEIERLTQKPVLHMDERLTTRVARLQLSERSEGKSFNHEKVDALAACLIAESCLESLAKLKRPTIGL
jgi:putative holliday junction resolvase